MSWDWEKLREKQKKQSSGSGGSGGGGNNDIPPQLEDFFKNFKGLKFSGGILVAVVIIVLLWGQSMVYTVKDGSVGIVQRFGEYVRSEPAGLNFKFPNGIETLTKVDLQGVRTAQFGVISNNMDESLMLTGDLNVAIVPWIVQYRIKDPFKFLFEVNNPEGFLRNLSESSMRLIIGDRSIDEVINERDEIAQACLKVLQIELDKANTGIEIGQLELQITNVPPKVQPSFNKVNKAEQEKETMILTARKEYNQAIPAARGLAERIIREGEGYAIDRTNRALGDAKRFTQLYAEYSLAKDVTKRRLYLETMRDVFPKIGKKYIIDSDQKNLLPFLNMTGDDLPFQKDSKQ